MRPPDLPSAKVLGRRHRHGHKMRYVAGCRCWRCIKGNKAYEAEIDRKRKLYGPNDLVDPSEVRAFLQHLQTLGIGYQTVAKKVGVAKTVLGEVLWPGVHGRSKLRRRTANKVLTYQTTLENLPRNLGVSAGNTVARVKEMLLWGIPKLEMSRQFGIENCLQMHALEGKTAWVRASTAIRVRDFHRKMVGIREVWTKAGRHIPHGQYVYWKPRKNGVHDFRLKHLELRPFAAGYYYHYIYPDTLKEVIGLKNKLKRAARKERKSNAEKHADRFTQSPVHGAGRPRRQRQPDGPGPGKDHRDRGRKDRGRRKSGGGIFRGHRGRTSVRIFSGILAPSPGERQDAA
jgi:hypothetical protein